VENTHAILHRFIPKKTDAKTLTKEQVQDAVKKLTIYQERDSGLKHLPR
jgi:IS30 family transposase